MELRVQEIFSIQHIASGWLQISVSWIFLIVILIFQYSVFGAIDKRATVSNGSEEDIDDIKPQIFSTFLHVLA